MVAMLLPTLLVQYAQLDSHATERVLWSVLLDHGPPNRLVLAPYVLPESTAPPRDKAVKVKHVKHAPMDTIKMRKAKPAVIIVQMTRTKRVMTTACVLVLTQDTMDATSRMVSHPILPLRDRPKECITRYANVTQDTTVLVGL